MDRWTKNLLIHNRKREIYIYILFFILPFSLLASQKEIVESARTQAQNAQGHLKAYHSNIILPRKSSGVTAKAVNDRSTARYEAENALRIYDALRSQGHPLQASDLILSGKCRLIALDDDRPSSQADQVRKDILDIAEKDFKSAAAKDPKSILAWAGQIDVKRIKREKDVGISVLKKVPPSIVSSAEYSFSAGRFYLSFNETELAVSEFEKAWVFKKSFPAALYLGVAKYMSGDKTGSRQYIKEAISIDPDSEVPALILEHMDGIDAVKKGKSPGPLGSQNLLAAGTAFEQFGDYEVALFFYEWSGTAMAGDKRALFLLGEGLAYKAREEKDIDMASRAAGLLEKSISMGGVPEMSPESSNIPLAIAYEAAREYGKAAQVYKSFVDAGPDYYRYYFDLARCLEKAGMDSEADSALSKGEDLAPKRGYSTSAFREDSIQTIGTMDQCLTPTLLQKGQANISGRVEVLGEGLPYSEVYLLLNNCEKASAPAITDGKGNFTVSLPPGEYVYNGVRVVHNGRPGEQSLKNKIYISGILEGLYNPPSGARYVPTNAAPGTMLVKSGLNPGLKFKAAFVNQVEVYSPAREGLIKLDDIPSINVSWKKVFNSHHYLIDYYSIEGDAGNALMVIPIRESIVSDTEQMALAGLFAAGMTAPQPGNYGLVVWAVSSSGEIVGRSPEIIKFTVN